MQSGRLEFKIYRSELNFDLYVFVYAGNIHDLFYHMMEMSSPAVAHHLRLLRSSGLIESRRDGKETYYRAVDSKKTQTLHHMIEKIMDISKAIKISQKCLRIVY